MKWVFEHLQMYGSQIKRGSETQLQVGENLSDKYSLRVDMSCKNNKVA